MNLRQIEAFKAMIEAGTVTGAAYRLNISQPAASKLLQYFERACGMALFTRERGRLAPTPEARLLYEEVERTFQGVSRIRAAADEIRALRRGTLAVGVMPALSVGFIQEVLARLQSPQHGLSVSVQARDTPKLVELLVTHQIELMFSARPMEHPEVRTETLCRLSLVCILPPGHHLAARREIRSKDLAGERFASFGHDSPIRRRIDQAFEDAKSVRSIALEAPMAPTLCAFVARGLGVALVNPLYVGAFAPALVVRPFRPRIDSEILMAMPRGRRTSAVADAFADTARAVAAEFQARR